MTTSHVRIGTAALAAALLAACSEHQDLTQPPPGAGQVVEVQLVDFAFVERNVTVEVGTTVRWRNTTPTFHTVTPEGHTTWNEFQTSSPGETFDVTFNSAGTYPFFCQPHRVIDMVGTVTVQ